ncbi:MAG: hypothetical protein Q4B67_07305 [Eubacteriales bacterium]|nr:hypothetical protein [Eubacteriales bacterium]
MKILAQLKANIQRFYADYDIYLNPLFKFLLAFVTLFLLKTVLGFDERISSLPVMAGMSFFCIFFPYGCITLVDSLFIALNMYSVSVTFAVIFGLYIIMVMFLFFGLRPGKGIILTLVPIFFILNIPAAIPVLLGLSVGITAVVPVAIGTAGWFIIESFLNQSDNITKLRDVTKIISEVVKYAKEIFLNKEMYVIIAAMAVAIIIIFIIKNLDIKYAWLTAVGAGAVCFAVVVIIGNIVLDVKTDYLYLILNFIASVAAGVLYTLLFHNVDYKNTERLQFEDDDYYYYVKAVPKVK